MFTRISMQSTFLVFVAMFTFAAASFVVSDIPHFSVQETSADFGSGGDPDSGGFGGESGGFGDGGFGNGGDGVGDDGDFGGESGSGCCDSGNDFGGGNDPDSGMFGGESGGFDNDDFGDGGDPDSGSFGGESGGGCCDSDDVFGDGGDPDSGSFGGESGGGCCDTTSGETQEDDGTIDNCSDDCGQPENYPPTCDIDLSPANTITVGTTAVLSWSTSNADSALVTRDGEQISTALNDSGKDQNLPIGTYVFVLRASADGETDAVCNATLVIENNSIPGCTDPTANNYKPTATVDDGSCTYTTLDPVCILTPLSQTIFVGQSAQLTLSGQNFISNTIDHMVGSVTKNVPFSVNPTQTTTYTATVTDVDGDTATCSADVAVLPVEQNLPVCTSFTATPDTTLPVGGGDVTLNWATLNTTKVTIKEADGTTVSQFINGETTTTYTATEDTTLKLIAEDNDGNVDNTSCQVTIDVTEETTNGPRCDSFVASPRAVYEGEEYTLTWETTDATTVSISGLGSQAVDGSRTITAPSVSSDRTETYVLTYSDGTTTGTCSTSVLIDNRGGGGGGGGSTVRCELEASDTSISAGEEVTLTWDNRRAGELAIYTDDEDDSDNLIYETDDEDEADDGSITVRPNQDTEYIMVIERGSTKRKCRVEIEVEDSVVVLENRNQIPRVAGISLTQVPYTGFDAGPTLTFIFYALLTFWALLLAYFFIRKKQPTVASVTGATPEEIYKKKVQMLMQSSNLR